MQQQNNITAIQLQHATVQRFNPAQNHSKSFGDGMGNLYPYIRPWYIHTHT